VPHRRRDRSRVLVFDLRLVAAAEPFHEKGPRSREGISSWGPIPSTHSLSLFFPVAKGDLIGLAVTLLARRELTFLSRPAGVRRHSVLLLE
jgi:hypothetical protein